MIFPGITWRLSNTGILKLRSKVSLFSRMLSLDNVILIVVFVDPAEKVAIVGVKVKSTPPPEQ